MLEKQFLKGKFLLFSMKEINNFQELG